jgi:hypothetical protein
MNETVEQKPDRNSLGRAAFVIGLIALALSFVPIVGFVSWLLAPLAILFGLVALRRPSKSLAIVGIITGAIALLVCYLWLEGTKDVGQALNADTFNTTGETQELSEAPIIDAAIEGLWNEMDANKVAAGQKYGGKRLRFSGERIEDFGGDAQNPAIKFEAARKDYLIHSVVARFDAENGNDIASLSKGDAIDFICTDVSETIMEGYSLSGCTLEQGGTPAAE